MIRMSPLVVVASFVVAALSVACSSKSEGGATGTGSCGVALSWKSDVGCQSWMDAHCCSQEKDCAADSACSSYVACVNACTVPRGDACITACGSAPATLAGAGACSKAQASDGTNLPNSCEWP